MRMMQQFRQKLRKWNSRTNRKTMMRVLNLVDLNLQIRTKTIRMSNRMKTKKDKILIRTIKQIKMSLILKMKMQAKLNNKQYQRNPHKLQMKKKKNQHKIQANQIRQKPTITLKKAMSNKTFTKPLQISKTNQNNQPNETFAMIRLTTSSFINLYLFIAYQQFILWIKISKIATISALLHPCLS
jgi:hypothetical protein